MKGYLVSVIIPCFNVEAYIEECMFSVLNQTYENIEVICVDNNSSDSTWEKLNRLKLTHPNIILLKEEKPGAPATRNKGLSIAKGYWVQFLDADDLLMREKIKHQISLLEEVESTVSYLAAGYRYMRNNGEFSLKTKIDSNPFTALHKNEAGITSSNLWKKDALMNVGAWDEKLKSSQEADLMMRLNLNGATYVVDRAPYTIIRERPEGQISQSDPVARWRTYLDRYFDYTKKISVRFPEEYKKYNLLYFHSLQVSILILAGYNSKVAALYYSDLSMIAAEVKPQFSLCYIKSKLIQAIGIDFWAEFVIPLKGKIKSTLQLK